MGREWPLIIVGGGLSGSLAALALRQRRPEVRFLLVEAGPRLGGNHVWSCFDSDLDSDQHDFVRPMVEKRWNDHEVAFPRRQRRIGIGYNSIRSSRLDAIVRSSIPPEQLRLGSAVDLVADDHVVVEGETLAAGSVIDARGFPRSSRLTLGWQKFIGRSYRMDLSHDVARPVIMDATVDQGNGYRFLYFLPFSDRNLFIEDTYYSLTPDLNAARIRNDLDRFANDRGGGALLEHEEIGVLPVVLAGDFEDLWPNDGSRVIRIGSGGGFFHPTTSYSLPDAVRVAHLICEQAHRPRGELWQIVRGLAERLWRERGFFRLLNRMLLNAAKPEERYRVLEHFYRLPEATIARFYAAELSSLDKARILTGRPPVSLGRALKAVVQAA